jgi:hypothetical protein
MTASQMSPPGDKRCQIYSGDPSDLKRCTNDGTHWVKWAGCECVEPDGEDCMDDFYSWECDVHDPAGKVAS